ncbi:MAG: DUF58 domain-containing protein [Planctomycetota bacterium]
MAASSAPAKGLRGIETPAELSAELFEVRLRRLADDLLYGADASRFFGAGVDYAQSRPFVMGDSVRSIDWRVTARTRRYHVREYEAPRRAAVYVVLDTSASMCVGSTRPTKHDAGVWIAGVLGFSALRALRPVAVMSGGERAVGASPRMSTGRIRGWLRDLAPAALTEQTLLAERLDEIARLAHSRSTVIVISDFHQPEIPDALNKLAARHECVAITLRDPIERRGHRAGWLRGVEAETGRRAVSFRGRPRSNAGQPRAELSPAVDQLTLETDGDIFGELRGFILARCQDGRGGR